MIPAKPLRLAKTRLSQRFRASERIELTLAMMTDVLKAVSATPSIRGFIVVSADPALRGLVNTFGGVFVEEERPKGVNFAVARGTRAVLARDGNASLIVPNDVPLISAFDLEQILRMGAIGRSVVITPSTRLDGTNALFRNPPDVIRTHYDEDSFRSHMAAAEKTRVKLQLYLNRRVMLDLDSVKDVADFLRSPSDTETFRLLSSFRQRT